MACLQVLKTSPQAKLGCFRSDSGKRRIWWVPNSVSGIVLYRQRLSVSCSVGDNQRNNGKEPPESLFSKELRKRGMTPESLLEEKNKSTGRKEEEGRLREEDGSWSYSRRNGIATNADVSNQREKSMALNSEGLEGLIPRAKALLTLGGTFFLAFWPLILVTVASFSALCLYFGAEFVHDGNKVPTAPPQYVDPYDLLEEERIYKTAPPVN